jgi:hypothetical protein
MASQQLVGIAAAGLGFAVVWHDRDVFGAALKGTTSPGDLRPALTLLGEVALGVVVITAIAGVSPEWAGVMGMILLILWLLWLMESIGGKKWVTKQTAKKGA